MGELWLGIVQWFYKLRHFVIRTLLMCGICLHSDDSKLLFVIPPPNMESMVPLALYPPPPPPVVAAPPPVGPRVKGLNPFPHRPEAMARA